MAPTSIMQGIKYLQPLELPDIGRSNQNLPQYHARSKEATTALVSRLMASRRARLLPVTASAALTTKERRPAEEQAKARARRSMSRMPRKHARPFGPWYPG